MSETPKYAGCAKCGGAAACWCGQPRLDTPAPDHAQAREIAEQILIDEPDWSTGMMNLARAYLALAERPRD
jgi:hypothetical protein